MFGGDFKMLLCEKHKFLDWHYQIVESGDCEKCKEESEAALLSVLELEFRQNKIKEVTLHETLRA